MIRNILKLFKQKLNKINMIVILVGLLILNFLLSYTTYSVYNRSIKREIQLKTTIDYQNEAIDALLIELDGLRVENERYKSSDIVTTKVSYYAEPFHGRKTRSGEIYDKNKLTCAAIEEYAFGTLLRVTNILNGKEVVVKVNDRGNFKQYGRALDLSERAFKELSNDKLYVGVLKVRVEKLTNYNI